MDNDAVLLQFGGVLIQEQQDSSARPIGHCSRTLSDSEMELATTHNECLAALSAILLLRPYLEGTIITVRTDHKALKWLFTMTDASGKLG